MKNFFLTTFCILYSASLTAQKTVHKVVEDNTITTIEINAARAYKLVVKTTNTSKIDIKAVMEGEYRDHLVINTRKEAGHFTISASFQPLFKEPDDKLSAHKVVSVLMIIELPENSDLTVSGGNTNINIIGTYNIIKASAENGNFILNSFRGNGEVRNFKGDIFVNNYPGQIMPQSRYGNIFGYNNAKEKTTLMLKTVNGNIYINKPK